MKSLNELDKLREKLQQDIQVRQAEHDVTVTVSMGTCGIAAGAREVVKAMLDELNDQGLSNVALTQTSCAGLCRHEPLVEITRGDEKTTYVHVDGNKAREIIKKHLVAGKIVTEWTAPEE